ncbi:MAG: DUF433 domain-containing protein [Deltaproteobacteria bacterium]|nr:DUF433 domain-containing protein [Deltaproteobacteria bacterium]
MQHEEILEHIVTDPKTQHGKPCIKGTRTPVYVILEALAMGMTSEKIKEEFPPITDEDIHACMFYAAVLANEQDLIPQL